MPRLLIACLILFAAPISFADCENQYRAASPESRELPKASPRIRAAIAEKRFDELGDSEKQAIDTRFAFAEDAVDKRRREASEEEQKKDWTVRPEWKDAIWKAHRTTAGQTGKPSAAQLLAKRRLLKDAGIPDHIVEALLREGVCGPAEESHFRDYIAEGKDLREQNERRLVYADYLDDIGEHDRAELNRIRVALSELPPNSNLRPELETRRQELGLSIMAHPNRPLYRDSDQYYRELADWIETEGDPERANYIRSRIAGGAYNAKFGISRATIGAFLEWQIFEEKYRTQFSEGLTGFNSISFAEALLELRYPGQSFKNAGPKVYPHSSKSDILKYAEWLENVGFTDRASLIRTELELEAVTSDNPNRTAIQSRRDALRLKVTNELQFLSYGSKVTPIFSRGLVVGVSTIDIRGNPLLYIRELSYVSHPTNFDPVKAAQQISAIRAQPPASRTIEIKKDFEVVLPVRPGNLIFRPPHVTFEFVKGRWNEPDAVIPKYSKGNVENGLVFGLYDDNGRLVSRFVTGVGKQWELPNQRGKFEIRAE